MKKWWTPDRVGAVVTIVLGVVLLFESKRIWSFKVSLLTGDHIMTLLCGAALIILGIILLLSKKQRKYENIVPEKETLIRMGLIFLTLFAYVILISLIGYTLSSLICTIALFRIFSSYPLWKCALIGCILTAVLYATFVVALEMPFPQGKLFL